MNRKETGTDDQRFQEWLQRCQWRPAVQPLILEFQRKLAEAVGAGPFVRLEPSAASVASAKQLLVCLRASIRDRSKAPDWVREAFRASSWDLRRALGADHDWLSELFLAPLDDLSPPLRVSASNILRGLWQQYAKEPIQSLASGAVAGLSARLASAGAGTGGKPPLVPMRRGPGSETEPQPSSVTPTRGRHLPDLAPFSVDYPIRRTGRWGEIGMGWAMRDPGRKAIIQQLCQAVDEICQGLDHVK